MRSLLLFILTSAGIVSSQILFTPGNEHVYTYSGKVLTGIPQLDNTFAGLAITGKVIVQATGQNTFKLAMRDVGFAKFNDNLEGKLEPVNWRNVVTPATNPVTADVKLFMESAVEFMMVKGEVTTVKISAQEPQWAVNFKKALVGALKVKLPFQQTQDIPYYWAAMEQGIEGVCENTYQVTELPEYLIYEHEPGMLKPEFCQGKKFFQVMKTRDITKCLDRAIFLSSKSHKNCLLGNCKGVNPKASNTRYFGCGDNLENLQLHGMINEGEMQHHVLPINAEPIVTGTKQVLKLVAIKPVTTVIPAIVAPKTLNDVIYEFPRAANNLIKTHEEQREFYKKKTADPANQVFSPVTALETVNKEEMKKKAIDKLLLVANQIAEIEHFGKKEMLTQVKALKSVFNIFTTEDLKAVLTNVNALAVPADTKETVRKMFFDIVNMAGTAPSIIFLKEMIEKELLTEFEMIKAVATLAHYVRTPTVELIDKIFELIKSPVIRNRTWLKVNAHLVFATIVRKACLIRPANEAFPEYIFGKMCTADNVKITQVYLPYLVKELKEAKGAEKQGVILALGALGHESVIPILLNYIEGKAEGVTPAVRKLAIFSLAELTRKYRHVLLPVFASIVHNPAETRGVRIAAFTMMVRMQPSTVHLQKLAVATWFEKDAEVHKFIFFTLRSLATIRLENHPEDSHLRDLTIKAKTVLPLAKAVPGIFSSTFNTYISEVLKDLQIGAQLNTAFITGTTSHILYHKTKYFLKQIETVPMEFAVHAGGFKFLANTLFEALLGDSKDPLNKIHPEWRKMVENMAIAVREDTPFNAGVFARFSDDIQLVFNANVMTVDYLKQKILTTMQDPAMLLKKVCGKTPINIHHAFQVMPFKAVVPSDLGLPIIVDTQANYLVNVKGVMDVMCTNPVPAITLKFAKKIAYNHNGFVGTICPFTKELLAAGINQHRAINIPIKTVVEIAPKTHTIKLVMKQIDEVTPTTAAVDMHHYHLKPFTAMKPLVFKDFTPMVLHKNTKVIKSKAAAKTFEFNFGQALGLHLNLKVDTECDLYDRKTILDAWKVYKFNPLFAFLFHFTETAFKANGMPTARRHKYTIVHNPALSTTKEAELNIVFTFAKKTMNEKAVKYVASESLSSTLINTVELPEVSQHEISLHESINKIDSHWCFAVNALVTAKLLGGQPKVVTYSLTAGKGKNHMEHKWNFIVENVNGVVPFKKIFVEGALKYPITPITDMKFKFFNHIKLDEKFINIDGTTAVTDKQKQFSKVSKEAKQCEKFTVMAQEMRKRIQTEVVEEEKLRLQRKYGHTAVMKHKVCSLKFVQANSLDEVVIDITASDALPGFVYRFGKFVNAGLKALLFEYVAALPVFTPTNKVQFKLNFIQKLNALTMRVETPMDTMVYKNIRLPALFKHMLPLVYGKNPVEHLHKALTGEPMYATCIAGQGFVQTFDKKTYAYQMDGCEHIISADCSKRFTHAVVGKEVNGFKHLFVYHKKTKVVLKPAENLIDFKLFVNGKEIALEKNAAVTFASDDMKFTYYAFRTLDNVVVLETPVARIRYTGKKAIVQEKSLIADGTHCGLCGAFNRDKRANVKSPKGCVLSSTKLAALTYRVKNAQCTLKPKELELIQAEEKKCLKPMAGKTNVWSLYDRHHLNNYAIKKHSYIYQGDKICISQAPVIQCAAGSTPKVTTMKTIKFVCLPNGRVSKLYAERIERGESPQELKHQPVAFEAKMVQPISCGPIQI